MDVAIYHNIRYLTNRSPVILMTTAVEPDK